MSILNKIRLVTLGTVNDLLDKTIDTNSPSAVRQYTRDVEDAMAKMQNEAAVQDGSLRTIKRERNAAAAKIESLTAQTRHLLASGTPAEKALAVSNASAIVVLQKNLISMDANIATQTATAAQLNQVTHALESKHTDLVSQVHMMEMMDRQTKAKESGSKAIGMVSGLMGSSPSVDNVMSRMQARNDVADAKLARSMGSFQDATYDPEHEDDVKQLLASLAPAQLAAPADDMHGDQQYVRTPELAAKT